MMEEIYPQDRLGHVSHGEPPGEVSSKAQGQGQSLESVGVNDCVVGRIKIEVRL